MNYSVGVLWGIYIAVVVITFLIFWLFLETARYYYSNVGYGTAFLLASVLGAFAAFLGALWLDPDQLSSTDKTWLSVLFVVALLLPIFTILYIIWAEEFASIDGCLPDKCKCPTQPCQNPCVKKSCDPPCPPKEDIYTKQIIHCDRDTGACHIKEKKIIQGKNETTVVYSSHK